MKVKENKLNLNKNRIQGKNKKTEPFLSTISKKYSNFKNNTTYSSLNMKRLEYM